MRCEKCDKEHQGKYGSGRFCSSTCARSFSTSKNRKATNQKVREKLLGSGHPPQEKTCPICTKVFSVPWSRRHYTYCSKKCKFKNPGWLAAVTVANRKKCKSLKERQRLRDIGRKGGFGKRGKTKNGTQYQSLIEKKCFEYLEKRNIIFEAHKPLPSSSKESDVYLPGQDMWIEIDGIDRRKRKKWLGKSHDRWLEKLKEYDMKGLKLRIVYSFEEFTKLVP